MSKSPTVGVGERSSLMIFVFYEIKPEKTAYTGGAAEDHGSGRSRHQDPKWTTWPTWPCTGGGFGGHNGSD